MQIKERSVWVGSVLGAILASACCLGPVILGAVGVGSLGAAATLAPYRPWFLVLTAGLLGVGFYLAYRPVRQEACAPDGSCAPPRSRTTQRTVLWSVSALTIVLATYPTWGARLGRPEAAAAAFPASAQVVVLDVAGMTCADCESEISRELQREPGVRQARVSYDKGRAWVAVDRQVSTAHLTAAVARAGYKARVESH